MTDRKTRAAKIVVVALIMVLGSGLSAWEWLRLAGPALVCWILLAVWDE